MGLDKLLIGLVAFSAIMFGCVFIIGNLNSQYNDISISTDDFVDSNDTINTLYNLSVDKKEVVYGGQLDDEETENSMFKGAFSAIRLLQRTFELIGDIITSIILTLGIPPFFHAAAMTALSIFIIFGLIFIIFRLRA